MRPEILGRYFFAAVLLTSTSTGWAANPEDTKVFVASRAFTPSTDDYGGTGLFQMPNARMQNDGELRAGYSHITPYKRYFVNLQALPWLDGTFRYTQFENRTSGAYKSNQAVDKGIDVKVRLIEEDRYMPAVAVSMRDIGGTQHFGSEFLSASKRYYNWDFTVGMAWGYASSGGSLRNPLGYLSSRFNSRKGRSSEKGGTLGKFPFHGSRTSLFGGVEYITPIEGLRLKAELDSNDYRNEPRADPFPVSSPFNIGVAYRPIEGMQIDAALERGNSLMLRATLHGNFNNNLGIPQTDTPAPKVTPRPRQKVSRAEQRASSARQVPARNPSILPASLSDLDWITPDRNEPDVVDNQIEKLYATLNSFGIHVSETRIKGTNLELSINLLARPDAKKMSRAAYEIYLGAVFPEVESVTFSMRLDRDKDEKFQYLFSELERSVQLTGSPWLMLEPASEFWENAKNRWQKRDFTTVLFETMEDEGLEVGDLNITGETMRIEVAQPGTSLISNAFMTVAQKLAPMSSDSKVSNIVFNYQDTASENRQSAFAIGHASVDQLTETTLPETPDRPSIEQQDTAEKVFQALARESFAGHWFGLEGTTASLYFSQGKYLNIPKTLGRAARIVANNTPTQIERIRVSVVNNGVPVNSVTIFRRDLENAAQAKGSVEEIWHNANVEPATPPDLSKVVTNHKLYPNFGIGFAPKIRQHVGGVDTFYAYQLWGQLSASAEFAPGLTMSGSLGGDIYNTFDKIDHKPWTQSKFLPHVRSDIVQYMKGSKIWLDSLSLSYIKMLAPDIYGRVSAGFFEWMYGGIGGEILYRPTAKRGAIGIDVNYVKQRGYESHLSFLDYEVMTGHVTYYHKLPQHDMSLAVSAGRYLAKDVGATLQVARTFGNGATLGAFATKTNISAEEFGEGSFDKGVYINIPFNTFFTKPTTRVGNFVFRPLTRDGGQMVDIPNRLYGVAAGSEGAYPYRGWGEFLD